VQVTASDTPNMNWGGGDVMTGGAGAAAPSITVALLFVAAAALLH
jgi:hypothetical protein